MRFLKTTSSTIHTILFSLQHLWSNIFEWHMPHIFDKLVWRFFINTRVAIFWSKISPFYSNTHQLRKYQYFQISPRVSLYIGMWINEFSLLFWLKVAVLTAVCLELKVDAPRGRLHCCDCSIFSRKKMSFWLVFKATFNNLRRYYCCTIFPPLSQELKTVTLKT